MSTSRTTTTTIAQPTASTSYCPANPPSPGIPADEDEDSIMRDALARVKRVKARKVEEAQRRVEEEAAARRAEEERKKKEATAQASAARKKAAQEARDRATRAQQQNAEVVERRHRLAEAATARSQRGTSPSEMSVSPWRPVVEIRREREVLGAVGGDPDDGDDSDDNDDDEEREPCERCKAKKIPCLQQAGKRSSVICKPCHDSKVRCSFSGRPSTGKREGSSGEQMVVMESQMAQGLTDLRALREANSKSHQYLHQLLRRQEDDHARLSALETRMSMIAMGEGSANAGPSRSIAERPRPLKRRRIVEETDKEEEEEEEGKRKEVEEKDKGVGDEEEMVEEETAPTEARSEKGKERAE
ncbi:hypothetical protein EV359DRAFT_87629 [Lentinula novae-zelandiae]|nr:hypothetical protein EV359DRAFT_87629 [Lentinula novae-zelandiae]